MPDETARRELLVTETRRPFLRAGLLQISRLAMGLIAASLVDDFLIRMTQSFVLRSVSFVVVFAIFVRWFLTSISRMEITDTALILEFPFRQVAIPRDAIVEMRVWQIAHKSAKLRIVVEGRRRPIIGRFTTFQTNWGTFEKALRELKDLARTVSLRQ